MRKTRRIRAIALWTACAALCGCAGDSADPLSASYIVEGLKVQLVAGRAETEAAPGSAAKISTSAFGQPAFGDLDGDGDDDAALILLRQPGGSGTFFYVAAAVNTNGKFVGTNALFLGDRIAPQDISIRNGQVLVNYADRRPDEPMTVAPSVGQSRYFALKDGALAAVDPAR